MSTQSAVIISDLTVKFGKTTIIPHLNLDLQQGQLIGLLGPSGSGKTTLVKAIMGMNKFSGNIKIFNQDVPSLELCEQIGYMAQNDALYEDLSALDNLLFFSSMFGLMGKEALQRANEMLDFVDLQKDKKKLVKNFSGGMKRRLSLAICLMHKPKMLILDEPTVGIDPLLREKFWNKFSDLKAEGCTIFVTTHVMEEAHHCDRIVLLREGRILANGSLDELFKAANADNIEDVFLYYEKGEKEEAAS